MEGNLNITRLTLATAAPVRKATITLAKQPIKATLEPQKNGEAVLHFEKQIVIDEGATLSVQLTL